MTAPFFPRILGAVAFLNQETEPLTMNLQHHFLIAMPALQDPIFRRSVVYICEHNTNGAMGIIVNKPLENLKIEGILEKLKITPEPRDESIRLDKPVMLGGPLAEDRGFILHTPPSNFASSIRISDNTVMTTSRDVLETLGTDKQPSDVLVALGYASWEKGQLEQEILDNAWLTAPADLNILFKTPIADRWREAAKLIGKAGKIITCHIGNGASISAVKDGVCVDTSMGFTPLAGVVMGTRSGDVDPFVPLYIMKTQNKTVEEVDNLLNKQSGMLGLCGCSDNRDVEVKYFAGDPEADGHAGIYIQHR